MTEKHMMFQGLNLIHMFMERDISLRKTYNSTKMRQKEIEECLYFPNSCFWKAKYLSDDAFHCVKLQKSFRLCLCVLKPRVLPELVILC